MELFIDTTNRFLIMAILKSEKVIKFKKEILEKKMTKMTNSLLDEFLKKNHLNYLDINKIYLTLGPGSFTSQKIGLNICKTIYLLNKKISFYGINSLKLNSMNGVNFSALKYTKSKYIFSSAKSDFKKIESKDEKDILKIDKSEIVIDYEKFNERVLEEKIKSNDFKLIKNILDEKPIYLLNYL